MSIIEFINSHPLINWSGVEQLVGAPKGTIRVNSNRSIPAKYQELIVDVIEAYGYNADILPQPKPLTVTNDSMLELNYYKDGMFRYISMDNMTRFIKPNNISVFIDKKLIKLPFEYKKSF